MITLILPYPISANRYWRPVNIGKHITIVPTKEAKEYKVDVAWRVRAAGIRRPITGRVAVEIDLYPNRPKDYIKRQREHGAEWDNDVRCIDLGNCEKVLSDALKDIAFEDDKWLWDIHLKRMEPDEHEARVVVRIAPIQIVRPQDGLLGFDETTLLPKKPGGCLALDDVPF